MRPKRIEYFGWVVALGIVWASISAVLLIPSLGSWFANQPMGVRWGHFAVATGAYLLMAGFFVHSYYRTRGTIFTTQGVWVPSLRGGRFIRWSDVEKVEMTGGHMGATHVQLHTRSDRVLLHAAGYGNPYEFNRLLRRLITSGRADHLPTEGEL